MSREGTCIKLEGKGLLLYKKSQARGQIPEAVEKIHCCPDKGSTLWSGARRDSFPGETGLGPHCVPCTWPVCISIRLRCHTQVERLVNLFSLITANCLCPVGEHYHRNALSFCLGIHARGLPAILGAQRVLTKLFRYPISS